MRTLVLCILAVGTLVRSDGERSWSYADGDANSRPENWHIEHPECGGLRQSPIDLDSTEAKFSGLLKDIPLEFPRYSDGTIKEAEVHLENNGHTAVVHVKSPEGKPINIHGAGLPFDYTLLQFHWHWGNTTEEGSEHTHNGKSYPAEIHFVHTNNRYSNDSAKFFSRYDGLAVIGVFIELGERNPDFDVIIDFFEHASTDGAHKTSVPLNLDSLSGFLPKDTTEFYRYMGSLTTPPCSESVIWTVMRNTIQMSETQLKKFRTLLVKDKASPTGPVNRIADNYRPIQPLNGRTLYASFTDKSIIYIPEGGHHWSYDGSHGSPAPAKWGDNYAKCYGHQQSPIHITHSESPLMTPQAWRLDNYDSTPQDFELILTNNGHSVVATATEGVSVSGGGLATNYKLAQFHFHWGSENTKGSEHLLDGKQFAAELHFVHVNKFYSKPDQIFNNHDGLAVLGVLIDVGDHNKAFDPIINELSKIKYISDTSDIVLKMNSLRGLLPLNINEFYRYHGSLTTPPCHEAVVWTVFKDPITMSEAQLNSFRSNLYNKLAPNNTNIFSDIPEDTEHDTPQNDQPANNQDGSTDSNRTPKDLVLDNYRPVQQLNDRIVKYAKITASGPVSPVSGATTTSNGLMLALVSLLFIKIFL